MEQLRTYNHRVQSALDRLDDRKPGMRLIIMLGLVIISVSMINFGDAILAFMGLILLLGSLLSRFTYVDNRSLGQSGHRASPYARELSLLGLRKMPETTKDLREAYVSKVKSLHQGGVATGPKSVDLDEITSANERLMAAIHAARNT